jgi:hypothetical protein
MLLYSPCVTEEISRFVQIPPALPQLAVGSGRSISVHDTTFEDVCTMGYEVMGRAPTG